MMNLKSTIAAAACAVAVIAGTAAPALAVDDFDYYNAEMTGDWKNVPNWQNPQDVNELYKKSPEYQQDMRRQQQQGQNQQNQQNQNQAQPQNNGTVVECESMNLAGQYAHKNNNGGVTLCANDDCAFYHQNFAFDTHDITVKGHSTNGNCARVDLYIGGQFVKSYCWEGTYNAECTIKGLHHVTGNGVEVKLVCKGDNGSWDAEIDSIKFENGHNEGITWGNENNDQVSWK